MIEIDEVKQEVIERVYKRARYLQNKGENHPYARACLVQGMNRARARDGRMLKHLDKGAEILRRLNDEQASRFGQEGYRKTEFNEFAQWRTAYEKMNDPRQDEGLMFRTLGWIYAAVAEELGR